MYRETAYMKYRIFAATRDEIDSGWVWIGTPKLNHRTIVRITNKDNKKRIYCEALSIDHNFLTEYNKPPRISIESPDQTLVINSWYRSRLGDIPSQTEYDIEIRASDNIWGKFRASLGHPQTVVRLAMWLGIISVILGIAGIGFGIIGLLK